MTDLSNVAETTELAARLDHIEKYLGALWLQTYHGAPYVPYSQAAVNPAADPASKVTPEVAALVRAGRKMEAISVYRKLTGAGLQEAKVALDFII